MLGGRLGIVATGGRSRIMHEDAIRYHGLEGFSIGCEPTNLGVLELETVPREKVLRLISEAARKLVEEKGADYITVEPRSHDGLPLVSTPPRIDLHYIRHCTRHCIHCYDSSIRTTEADLAGSAGYSPYIVWWGSVAPPELSPDSGL